jgi:DNA-binding ferritin-like protein
MHPITEVIRHLMQTKDNLQLYHWNTKSYAKHKATDELIVALAKNIDDFVEVYLGVNIGHTVSISDIKIKSYTDSQLSSALMDVLGMLSDLQEGSYQVKPSLRGGRGYIIKLTSDLINIRDEIMGNIHKTLYLLTLS